MKSIITKLREMNKEIIVFIDYLFWLIFDFSKFKVMKKEEIKKVLIIHLGAMGELIQTTPILPIIKKGLNCQISYLTAENKGIILKNNPYISEILIFKDDFKEDIKNLKNKFFDLAIILFPATFKINLMCLITGIKYRIGCFPIVKGAPSFFLTRRIFPFRLWKKNVLEEGFVIIRQLGINIDTKNSNFEFYISDEENTKIRNFLDLLKIKDFVIIHPAGSFTIEQKNPSRLLPLYKFSRVINYLTEKYRFKVILTGDKHQKILSEKIKSKARNKKDVIIVNDLFLIREIGALISKSKLMISTGTCVVHIAESFDIPLVVFEGRGNPPNEVYPYSPNCRFLFHPEVCTGCNKNYCRKGTQECMRSITIKEIKNAVDSLLNQNEIYK